MIYPPNQKNYEHMNIKINGLFWSHSAIVGWSTNGSPMWRNNEIAQKHQK